MNDFIEHEDAGQGGGGFLSQLPAMLWDRRWWIIIPSILGVIGAVAAALLIPPVYRSTAVMLVQSPQLSNAVLGENGDDIVERRIARIREQATSRPDLVSLIERHGLYASDRKRKPLSKIIEDMRADIALVPNVAELPGNRADERTIAFELSFEYDEPQSTQAVTQDLMQRIVELDAAGNAEQANNRVQFLSQQADDLAKQIAGVQGQITAITSRNGSILGGSAPMIGNTGSYDVQIAQLQRDNANLVNQKNMLGSADTRDPVVASAEAALAAARSVYSDNHPDVIAARQRLAEARQLAKSNIAKLPVDTLDQQIAFNNSQIAMLRAAKSREEAQMMSAMTAQSRAPMVQQQISDLQSQLAGMNEQYKQVSDRLLAARAGVRAEDEQLGERLSVIDPPVVPDKPVRPDRLLIAAIGVGGGIALGVLMALAVELLMRPIRSPQALSAIMGGAPMALIPVIESVAAGAATPRRGLLARLWPFRKRET